MSKRMRWVSAVLGGLVAAFLLAAGLAYYAGQTGILKEQLRARLVRAIETASGGRVALRSFDLDWRNWRITGRDLVVHGIEAVGERPLLEIRSFEVRLKVLSLFRREMQIAVLSAEQPQVHLIVRPDGSTNVPRSAGGLDKKVEQLFALRVNRYELQDGSLWINSTERRFSLRGEDLKASAAYQVAPPAYALQVATQRLLVDADCCRGMATSLALRAKLRREGIDVQELVLRSGGSILQASGTLRNFVRPMVDGRYSIETTAHDLAKLADFDTIRAGRAKVDGTAHYDVAGGWRGEGRLRAHDVAYASLRMAFEGAAIETNVQLAGGTVRLRDIEAHLLGGTFKGQATLKEQRKIAFDGRLAGVVLRQLAVAGRLRPIPWDGEASGRLAGGTEEGLRSDLKITPLPGKGQAVAGRVMFSASKISEITFADSELTFPNTKVQFSGSQSQGFEVDATSTNLADIKPALRYLDIEPDAAAIPELIAGGTAHFSGHVQVVPAGPAAVAGSFSLGRFRAVQRNWDKLEWQGALAASLIDASSFTIEAGRLHLSGAGEVQLQDWKVTLDAGLRLRGSFRNVDLAELRSLTAETKLPHLDGLASGTLDLSGSLRNPAGDGHVTIDGPSLYGEKMQRLEADGRLNGNDLHITRGKLTGTDGDAVAFSATYSHLVNDWRSGDMDGELTSRGFAITQLGVMRRLFPEVAGRLEMRTAMRLQIAGGVVRPLHANGDATLRNLAVAGETLGTLVAQINTQQDDLRIALRGDVRGSNVDGGADIKLTPGNAVSGHMQFERLRLATLSELLVPTFKDASRMEGFLRGGFAFEGRLDHTEAWRSTVRVDQLTISPAVPVTNETAINAIAPRSFDLHNTAPIVLDLAQGVATIRSLELVGRDTRMRLEGSAGFMKERLLNLNLDGSCSLQLLQWLDPEMESGGESTLRATIRGTMSAPLLTGRLQMRKGALGLRDSPNGLSNVNGDFTFNQDRATIEKMTADFGGGQLSLAGFVSFGGAAPLAYHLEARANDTRIRYAGGISATADANLRLTGTSSNSLLSGAATITHVVFNPNTDVGNVLTHFAILEPAPANRKTFFNGVQLDLTIESAGSMQLSTALSRDVEAQVDLRLRGTPERPILLGTVSANQGDIRVFGARYAINRGEVRFLNTARIEPVLDLDLQTQARGINVDITISGTLNRLNITYRSDPPLQPRDIIALLTVGRTPQEASNVQTTQVAVDTPALQSGASSVLGQAVSPPSGRLSKLFGITNIKIDPLVQGITNTPQSRLTLEQQISRSITVTYVTNLEQTSEQIFRFEWAINRQYSLVAVRDDNGEFGIDFQYKRRFK